MSIISDDKGPCCFMQKRPQPFQDLPERCQFEGFEEDNARFTVEGQMYCQFHIPLVSEQGWPTEKTSWGEEKDDIFEQGIRQFLDRAWANKSVADLTGVQFPRGFDFSEWAKTTSGKGNWQHSPFPKFCAHGAHFTGDTNFSWIEFSNADFTETVFGHGISFESSNFLHFTEFRDATFGISANFHRAEFEHGATFAGAHFGLEVDFSNARFCSPQSGGEVWFIQATFGDGANFEGTKFYCQANFNSDTNLKKTTFGRAVNFRAAEFHSAVKFTNTEIGDGAIFEGSVFKNWVDFAADGDTPPFKDISFKGAKFLNAADFSNRKFSRAAKFDGAEFNKAPLFHGAELHQGSTIADAIFHDVSGDAARAYGTLKHAMQQLSAWDDMATFQVYEQKSICNQSKTSWTVKKLSKLYEAASDYGRSATLPIVWMCGLMCVCFFLYLFFFSVSGNTLNWSVLANVLHFDLLQMARPLHALAFADSQDTVLCNMTTFWRGVTMLTAALQSLTTLSLATLFILAVRRRFRMA